jgi:hypothetical protein
VKRVRRILFNLFAAASAVLFVATAAIGIRGFFANDRLLYSRFDYDGAWVYWVQWELGAGKGGMGISRIVQASPSAQGPAMIQRFHHPLLHRTQPVGYPDFKFDGTQPKFGFSFRHFAHGTAGNRPRAYAFQIIVPIWILFLAFGGWPLLAGLLWRKRRDQRMKGKCLSCGYDLRATPKRCPECGTVPSEVADQAPA